MNAFILFYNSLLTMFMVAGSPILAALLAGKPKHRAGLLDKLLAVVPVRRNGHAPIWYHAVSVGEVMASIPLLRGMREAFPHSPLWVSTVTSTGRRTALQRAAGLIDEIFYFPFDMPWTIDKVIRRMSPLAYVTMETEIWPNCLWRLKWHNIPVILVNGRISDGSFVWYRRFALLFRRVVSQFDLLCMQSQEMAERIVRLGAEPKRVKVTGNLKFDLELPQEGAGERWSAELGLQEGRKVLVFGSTHPGEEVIILRVYRRLRERYPELKVILAPRSPERFDEVASLVKEMGLTLARRSLSQRADQAQVLLLDTIGELSQVYCVADAGFVGGSLIPRGGHNPLEIAAHGKAVLFGPHMNNFREISTLLVNGGGAMMVRSEGELTEVLEELLSDEQKRVKMGRNARETLMRHQGATQRTLCALRGLLKDVRLLAPVCN
jgi:3-deoxy-D-manno-octulosonic-acid transferase